MMVFLMLTTPRVNKGSSAKWDISPVKRIGANNQYTIRHIEGKGLVTAPGKNSYICYHNPKLITSFFREAQYE